MKTDIQEKVTATALRFEPVGMIARQNNAAREQPLASAKLCQLMAPPPLLYPSWIDGACHPGVHMLSLFRKPLFNRAEPAHPTASYAQRLAIYQRELGEPEFTSRDRGDDRIDVHAFGRDFVPDCEEGVDEGYVLLTNGMSEQRMAVPDQPDTAKARAELMWYVREGTPEICANLRWLARVPFIDNTWFGFGHRMRMPTPPVPGTDFRTFLFLTPIIGPDKCIAERLSIAGESVEILTINLISDRELELIKNDGLDAFLDLLDDNDYPAIFDPARKSYA